MADPDREIRGWGGGGGGGGGTVAAGTPLPDNILVECQSRVS